jgi:hypothetical protein
MTSKIDDGIKFELSRSLTNSGYLKTIPETYSSPGKWLLCFHHAIYLKKIVALPFIIESKWLNKWRSLCTGSSK